MQIFDILGRIMGGFFSILALVAYLAWRWKRASDVSEAEAADRKAAREGFEQLKHDRHFHHLLGYLNQKYRTTYDAPADGVTYQIRYIGLMSEKYERLFLRDGAQARYMVAYLERRAEPSRIQATLDLRSGACADMAMGWMGWDGLVPQMW